MALETPATVADVVALVPAAGTLGPASTGSITVISFNVAAGDSITYAGLTLTAVDGARTSGSDNFQGDLGLGVAATAAEILAAIQDPLNSWATVVTGTVAGAVVSLTTIATGSNSVGALTSSDLAMMTTTGMTGGDILILTMVNVAASMVNVACWGEKTCDATKFLALHFLASVEGGFSGAKPTATSIKIKDIGKTYSVATPTDALFGSTQWGKMYLMLYETVFCSGTTGADLCLGVVG